MNLSNLTSNLKVKTDFNANSALGLNDINGITGIVDNSISSLQALIFANKDAKYDEVDVTNFDITGITSGYDNVAFIFDLKKDYKYTLSSDITDHYVESNVAIQDHIGLKPIMLEVVGCISEVNLRDGSNFSKKDQEIVESNKKGNIFNSIDSYLNRMGSLTSFAPNIVNQALNVYNTAKYVYGTANKFINMNKKDYSKKIPEKLTEDYNEDIIATTKQFNWIDWFTIQWKNRASFTIVTPYGVLKNMYIMDLNAVQPENTRYITNLNIKFKQIRTAKVIKQNRKVAQTMETQIKEHGLLVRKDEYGNIIVDATTDMTEAVSNGNYDLSGSKILNEGATSTYNVSEKTNEYTLKQLETNMKSYGITTPDTKLYSKILGAG